jgi:hypothetical protein
MVTYGAEEIFSALADPTRRAVLEVRNRHSGFAAHPEIATAHRGWPNMLSWLQAFLEKGETVIARMPH